MWDVNENNGGHLSRDLPCVGCGHAGHTYLPCSDSCGCAPPPMPGAEIMRLVG
ncbi:hypothetical protein GCM10027026_27870 [Myroides odoratimimus subsp. xuanwuensis]